MTQDEKKRIVAAARQYMADHNISQNKLKELSGVTYLPFMFTNEEFKYKNAQSGEMCDIPEKWFVQLAQTIGYSITSEAWPMVVNDQVIEMLRELEEAKATATMRILIGSTGCGKTYIAERFKRKNPAGTYLVTCHRFDRLDDLIDKIMAATGIKCEERRTSRRLERLRVELWRRHRNGERLMLIFDESENLTIHTLQMLKALYDFLKTGCSIVLIGTDQLTNKLEALRRKNTTGIPQLYRRFKAGIRYLKEVDTSFDAFFAGKDVATDAKRILRNMCDNYGELADYLEPALRAANGQPVTAELLRTLYKL